MLNLHPALLLSNCRTQLCVSVNASAASRARRANSETRGSGDVPGDTGNSRISEKLIYCVRASPQTTVTLLAMPLWLQVWQKGLHVMARAETGAKAPGLRGHATLAVQLNTIDGP